MSGTSAISQPAPSHRVLGIDPGLQRTGFGVIEVDGPTLSYVASGVIRTTGTDLPDRLGTIYRGISEIVATYTPSVSTIEKVFVNVNPQSTLLLGQARGAAISALVMAELPVYEYTALQLKQSVTGHGHAAKEQIQAMVCRLLALPGEPSADAADGLACAICHVHSHKLIQRLPTQPGSGARLRMRNGRLV